MKEKSQTRRLQSEVQAILVFLTNELTLTRLMAMVVMLYWENMQMPAKTEKMTFKH